MNPHPDAGLAGDRTEGGSAGNAPTGITVAGTRAPLIDAYSVETGGGLEIVLSSIAGGCTARMSGDVREQQTRVVILLDRKSPGTYTLSRDDRVGLVVEELGAGCAVVEKEVVSSGGAVVIDRIDADGVHGTLTVPGMGPIAMSGLEGEFLAPGCAAPHVFPLECSYQR